MISLQRARTFLKLPLALAIGMASITAQQASAHGYIESPPSRVFMCNKGENTDCLQAAYNPQGIEYMAKRTYQGYPSNAQACDGDFRQCGPADGYIASAGMSAFGRLNEQTSNRWKKNTIKPGPQTFTWHYTAQHKTRYYQFYITKKDWNPNEKLTRASFEMTPLLDEPWGGRLPGAKTRHTVNIPADRSGYHVLLAVWKVDDNVNSFYQVVDLNIDNPGASSGPVTEVAKSAWTDIGALQPDTLKVGDKVQTRVFTGQGELLNKQVTLEITTAAMADRNTWPQELAKKVNAANFGYQIGELNAKDQVIPSQGRNSIFANKDSGITSVLIDKIVAATPTRLNIAGVQAEYPIKDGQVELSIKALLENPDPNDKYYVTLQVFDADKKRIHHVYGKVGDVAPQFLAQLKDIKPGEYDLVLISHPAKGQLQQESFKFKAVPEAISAKYDYSFPQGLGSYKAGTLVLQPKDGHVYECTSGLYATYCKHWSAGMDVFEPGVGSSWDWAWTRK